MTTPLSSPSSPPAPGAFLAATIAIAATYVYFLIFAEFAFLEFARRSVSENQMPIIMGALGLAGVAGSFAAAAFHARRHARCSPALQTPLQPPPGDRSRAPLATGFAACSAAALASLAAKNAPGLALAAAAVGLSLGWSTVTLSLRLHTTLATRRLGLACGLGTGIAYALSNHPALFNRDPATQIRLAAFAALAGLVANFGLRTPAPSPAAPLPIASPDHTPVTSHRQFSGWVALFLILVALDSFAFFFIQHSPSLKQLHWQTPSDLHANATIHLLAAVLAGCLLDRRGTLPVTVSALVLLSGACWFFDSNPLAHFAYISGVSLYSSALVYFPARSGLPWRVATLFAISGWIGSALAIGAALDAGPQHLSTTAPAIALLAGGLSLAWIRRSSHPL